ncbi:MAG: hypothetical protein ABUK01_08940 [Leptospirales bacterium]
MQINKNDILNFIQNIQKKESHHEDAITKKAAKSDIVPNKEPTRISVDAVRSHVMNLQDEVKNIQTQASRKQIQVAYLEELPDVRNWKKSLQDFLKKEFPGPIPIIQEDNKDGYISQLMHEIRGLNNSMLTREVKLENIISTGMVDLDNDSISEIIMKDFTDVTKVFSRLRKDSISHLFQN